MRSCEIWAFHFSKICLYRFNKLSLWSILKILQMKRFLSLDCPCVLSSCDIFIKGDSYLQSLLLTLKGFLIRHLDCFSFTKSSTVLSVECLKDEVNLANFIERKGKFSLLKCMLSKQHAFGN